jgi:hypothetical protein
MGGEERLAKVTPLRPRRGRWFDQWPLASVLLVIAAGIGFVALDEFRIGSLLLAAGILVGFGLRAVLPTSRAGLLAVRGRTTDLVVLGLLGSALLVFALWVPVPT